MKTPRETLDAIAKDIDHEDMPARVARASDPVAVALRAELAVVLRELEADQVTDWMRGAAELPESGLGSLSLVSVLASVLGRYVVSGVDPLSTRSALTRGTEGDKLRAMARRVEKRLGREQTREHAAPRAAGAKA